MGESKRRRVILKDLLLAQNGYIRGPFGSALRREDLLRTGEFPVYEQKNAIEGHREFRYFVDESKYKEMARFSVREDDLIISCSGTIGSVSVIDRNDPIGIISQALLILRPNTSIVLPSYLKYFILSPYGQHSIISVSSGSVQVNIARREIIENISLELPDITEQQRIVEALSSLDEKIELNQRMNLALETIARSIFKSWFVDFDPVRAKAAGRPSGLQPALDALFPSRFVDSELGEIPEGWRVRKIGEVLVPLLGGTPSRSIDSYWEGGTIPWINSGAVNNFRVTTPTEMITAEGFDNSSTKLIPPRTTVIAITGATLGKISLVEIETAFNQSIVAIPSANSIPGEFVYLWTKSVINSIVSWQTGGAQQHINKQNVADSNMLCPSSAVLSLFCKLVSPMFDIIANKEFESNNLINIRDSLLKNLLAEK